MVVAALSCVGDSTGPQGRISGRLALVPSFQSSAAGIVDFDRIRITLVRLDETVPVLDTIIQIPPTADSIDLSLSVPLRSSSEDLLFYLRLIDAAGDTVFRNEPYPQQITVTPGTRPAAVPTPLAYIGVGADAAAVIIATPDTLVPFGQSLALNASARDSAQQTIPGTPIEWLSLDSLRVRVPNRRVGQVVGATQRGPARIVARLLTGPADTVIVKGQPVPVLLSVVGGNGQTGTPGSPLPVPLRVRVTASDGLGVQVPVSFAALYSGATVTPETVVSDTLGYAEAAATLGYGTGPQQFAASVAGIALPTAFTAMSVSGAVASVTVDQSVDTIAKGATLQYTATARDSLGNPVSVTVGWTVSPAGIATVDGTGLATGLAGGATSVIATAAGHADTAQLYVRAIVSLSLNPADTIATAVGDSFALRPIALDNFGDTLQAGLVIRYTSAATGVAVVDSLTGMVRTTGPGNGVLLARESGSGIQGAGTVRVNQVVDSVASTPHLPDTLKIGVGGRGQVTARALDRNGYAIPGKTFSFVSRNTGVATVSATGLVSGVALGSAFIVDSLVDSVGVFRDSTLVEVVTTPPAKIQWGYDSIAVGNGGSISVALSLSKPDPSPITIRAVSSDSFIAKPQSATAVVPAGTPGTSMVLLGRSAGRVLMVAEDAGGVYLPDTMVLDVVSTIELREVGQFFQQTNFYINRNETRRVQVFLSDPAPAGGLGVTFVYGAPGTSSITPSPAIIPAGQLSAEVVVQGLAAGTDQVTPTSGGFVGRFSNVHVAPNNLDLQVPYPYTVGAGQTVQPYVQIPNTMDHPLVVATTLTPAIGVTPDTVTITTGTYYRYFTVAGTTAGTMTLRVSAPGWNPDSQDIVITTPQLGVYGTTSIVAGDPTRGQWGVYTQDSVFRYNHPVTDTVTVTAVSRNPAAVAVDAPSVTVLPGQASAGVSGALRALATAGGDSAWVVVTATGYRPDSFMVRVTPPALQLALSYPPGIGLGMRRTNAGYVQIPYVRPDTVAVIFAHTRRGVVSGPDTVRILPGATYTYFDIAGDSLGADTISAQAGGYQTPISQPYTVVPLRVRPYSYPTTLYTISRPQQANVYALDSVWGYSFPLVNPLTVNLASSDTAVIRLDSATVTIPTGSTGSNYDTLRVVGTGAARLRTSGATFPPDSSNVITVNPTPITLSVPYPGGAGWRLQLRNAYVYLPDRPADTVRVALSRLVPGVDSLSTDTLKIPPTSNYSGSFDLTALDSAGVDTIVASAPGFVSDSATFAAVPAQVDVQDIGATHLTTEPPYRVITYTRMRPSPQYSQYPVDTIVYSVVSTDSSVIQIDSALTVSPTAGSGTSRVTPAFQYGYFKVRFVGSGTARLVVSAPGFGTDSTSLITVTGPTLRIAAPTVTVGTGQIYTAQYVYVDNAVPANLVVRLGRSDSTLSPASQAFTLSVDSVIIPAGLTYSPAFDIGGNAIGSAQLVARATGYSQVTATVQVGQPRLSSPATLTTYVGIQPPTITVATQDQNSNPRIVAAATAIGAISSAPGVAQPDVASRDVAARAASTTFQVQGISKGSVDLVFSAPGYRSDTTVVTVDTAKLDLQSPPNGLGPGQVGQAYVQLPGVYPSTAMTVTLSSTNPAVVTVPGSAVISTNTYYVYFDVTGVSAGQASIIATAPNARPDTIPITIGSPRLTVTLGATMVVGSKATITVYARDSLNVIRPVSTPLTVTVSSSDPAHTVFDSTTITIPAGGSSVQTGVVFDTAGSYTITAAAGGYSSGNATTAAGGAIVRVLGTAFVPTTVTISRNQYVTWRNEDGVDHTTTSDSAGWNATLTGSPPGSFQRFFNTAGSYTYHCNIHPSMTGTVVVNP